MQDLKEKIIRGGAARGFAGGQLGAAHGRSRRAGAAVGPEGFRVGRHGHGIHRRADLVPRFRAVRGRRAAPGHHQGSAFEPLLGQRPARGAAGARDAGGGAGHCRVLPRASPGWGGGGAGDGVPVQRGGDTALRAVAAADALHRHGGDRRHVADGRHRDRHRRSRNRLRILGARRIVGDNPACRQHRLLAGDGLGPRACRAGAPASAR